MRNITFRRSLLASTIAASAFALTPAMAQDPAAAPAAEADAGDTIVVTGSRIARPELQASVPIAVVGANNIAATGATNIQDTFKDLPSVGQSLDRTSSNFQSTGNGQATVNLRSLGDSRTLVLVNGRRSVGVPGDSAVDLNNVPTDLIDHVEIVTGGASAVYGSDAVAGVVNIILKNKFTGLEIHGQNLLSDKGDSQNHFISITAGHDFAGGKGHLVLSGSFNSDAGLIAANRSFSAHDPLNSSYAAQGVFDPNFVDDNNPPFVNGSYYTFSPQNTLKPFQGNAIDGYDRNPRRYLSVPIDRYQGALIGSFEFSDAAQLYVEGSYTKTKTNAGLEALAVDNFTDGQNVKNYDGSLYAGIPITSPYVPAALAAAAQANGTNVLQFKRRSVDIFSRSNSTERDFYRGVIGVKGDFLSNWHYDLSFEHSEYKDHTTTGAIFANNYGAALNNELGPTGQIQCSDPAARAAGCVPINIFGYNTVTPAAAAWLMTYTGANPVPGATIGQRANYDYRSHAKQDVATAAITGSFFNLPGGPVGVALGAEYRKEKSEQIFDPFTQAGATLGTQIANTVGQFDVKEAFAEVNIPILADVPFVKELSLEGAARYADYSTVGGTWTYKFGGAYAPTRDIRFRAIYAQAVRAPNISELYAASSQTAVSVIDPCDQAQGNGDNVVVTPLPAACATIAGIANWLKTHPDFTYNLAQIQSINGLQGGNPDLQQEKTSTFTAGAVFTPSFFRGFSLTVDYYTIKVKNAIGPVNTQSSVVECVQNSSSPLCANVTRNANTGFISSVDGFSQNLGSYLVSGIDFQAHYRLGLDAISVPGSLDLTLFYTHKIKQQQISFPGGPVSNEIGQADCYSCGRLGSGFKDQFTLNTVFATGPLELTYRMKYLGPLSDNLDGSTSIITPISAYVYHDLQASITVDSKKRFELYGGVNNLLDTGPPIFSGSNPVTFPGTNTVADTYDTFGRLLYVGFRAKF